MWARLKDWLGQNAPVEQQKQVFVQNCKCHYCGICQLVEADSFRRCIGCNLPVRTRYDAIGKVEELT